MILASDWSKNVACRRGTKRTKVPAVTHSRSRKLASGTCPIRLVNCLDRPPSPSRTHRARPPAIRTSPPARSRVPIRCRTVPGINRLIRAPRPPPQVKMRVAFLAIALMGLVVGANAGAVDLTSANFDAEVLESGKAAFVKFLAPWCVLSLLPSLEPPRPLFPDLRRAKTRDWEPARASIHPGRAHTDAPGTERSSRGAPVAVYRAARPRATPIDPALESPMPNVASPSQPEALFFWFFFGFFVKRIADPFPSPCPTTGEATASR